MTVLAATAWPTNADMILDLVRLGYLIETDRVLDPTHGLGRWWTKWRPHHLVTSDVDPNKEAQSTADFRDLPFPAESFDVVAYDPPYVCVGGRKTTGIPGMFDRYGLTNAPTTPARLQRLVNDGLIECHRVVRRRGLILAKCQDYVWGGRLWIGTHHTLTTALSLGMELVDRLEHLSGVRPQPGGRRQVHARRNFSTMLVLRRMR